ncbi:MAG: DUF58 domain-containing protein [Lachnospiraceae bacterium]|nr:DUF58 domain-containing protein [Lachnospiraceae bacterium]
MEGKIRFRLRPIRIISYLISIGLDIFLYYVLHSYFLLLIAIVMSTLPLISIVGAFYTCKNLEAELGIGKSTLEYGEEVLMEIRLKNHAWFPALHSNIKVFLSNTFLENTVERVMEMPVKAHGDSTLGLSFRFINLGCYTIEADTFFLQDLMGLIIVKKPINISGEIYVLPNLITDVLPDVTHFMAGAAEVEESTHKGSDFSEVSDIREYVPGDRIRDIHWKISARCDELMVKERVSTAGSEMVLFPDLIKNDDAAQHILTCTYSLALSFIRQRLPVCIICWNQTAYCFDEYRFDSDAELVRAYSEIYRQPLTKRINGDWMRLINSFFPYLKSYIHICIKDDSVQVEMLENS